MDYLIIKLTILIVLLIVLYYAIRFLRCKFADLVTWGKPFNNLPTAFQFQLSRTLLHLLILLAIILIDTVFYKGSISIFIQSNIKWIRLIYIAYFIVAVIHTMQRLKIFDNLNYLPENYSIDDIKLIIEQKQSIQRYHENILYVYTAFAPVSILILILTGIIDEPEWLETFLNNSVYIALSITLGTYIVLLGWRLFLYKRLNREIILYYNTLIRIQREDK